MSRLIDTFTPDATIELKHSEFYDLMYEAAKAELLTNAVKADVPNPYINAMLTGEKVTFKDFYGYISEVAETETNSNSDGEGDE